MIQVAILCARKERIRKEMKFLLNRIIIGEFLKKFIPHFFHVNRIISFYLKVKSNFLTLDLLSL